MRYKKLGTIKKKTGIQIYEYQFNEALLEDGITEVYIVSKPKKQSGVLLNDGQHEVQLHKSDGTTIRWRKG